MLLSSIIILYKFIHFVLLSDKQAMHIHGNYNLQEQNTEVPFKYQAKMQGP